MRLLGQRETGSGGDAGDTGLVHVGLGTEIFDGRVRETALDGGGVP